MSKFVRPLRVLVVDEKIIADTLVGFLRTHNYDAAAVYSAEDAMSLCRDRSPYAVITEVLLGPMSGVQLAIQLAKKYPNCKVLMTCANSQVCTRLPDSKAFSEHFTLFSKPVNPQKILDFLASQ